MLSVFLLEDLSKKFFE